MMIKRQDCEISTQVQFLIGDRLYLSFIKDEEYQENFSKLIKALKQVCIAT